MRRGVRCRGGMPCGVVWCAVVWCGGVQCDAAVMVGVWAKGLAWATHPLAHTRARCHAVRETRVPVGRCLR